MADNKGRRITWLKLSSTLINESGKFEIFRDENLSKNLIQKIFLKKGKVTLGSNYSLEGTFVHEKDAKTLGNSLLKEGCLQIHPMHRTYTG